MTTNDSGKRQDALPDPTTIALAVTDSVRDVRDTLKRAARTMAADMRAGTVAAPLGPLRTPLGTALDKGIGVLDSAEDAVLGALPGRGRYRRLDYRLLTPTQHLAAADRRTGALRFSAMHYASIRHVLGLAGRGDIRVREYRLHEAFLELCRTSFTTTAGAGPCAIDGAALAALYRNEPLVPAIAGVTEPRLADYTALRCAAAVLAPHAAALYPAAQPAEETGQALELSFEAVRAQQSRWASALQATDPASALVELMRFVLRHL